MVERGVLRLSCPAGGLVVSAVRLVTVLVVGAALALAGLTVGLIGYWQGYDAGEADARQTFDLGAEHRAAIEQAVLDACRAAGRLGR